MTDNAPLNPMTPEEYRHAVRTLTTVEDVGEFLNKQLEKLVEHGVPRDRVGAALVATAIIFLMTQHGPAVAADLLAAYADEARRPPLRQADMKGNA